MKASSIVLLILIVSLFGFTANGAQKLRAVSSPDAVVRELYRVHRNGYGPLFEKRGKKYHDKFFDKNLAGLIWKDFTETPEGEVGNLDFDPLFKAQDFKITRLRVGAPVVEGEKVYVPVSFNNFGKKQSLKFTLINEDSLWKVANIDYGEGIDLVGLLSRPVN
jgi:hypothetical protein